jgi:restriction system protein
MARRQPSYAAAVAKAQRERLQAEARAVREEKRAHAALVRAAAADERRRKALYAESRLAEVDQANQALVDRLAALGQVLAVTLGVDDFLDFETLKEKVKPPSWKFSDLERATQPPQVESFLPPAPTLLTRLFAKASHERAVHEAQLAHDQAVQVWRTQERVRVAELERQRGLHTRAIRKEEERVALQNQDVDEFRSAFDRGDPDSVIQYLELVLMASKYPEGFPQSFRIAYVPASRQAVVEYELPHVEVVPTAKSYKYFKSSDKVTELARPVGQLRDIYASLVAQVALRTVHELFEADRGRYLDVVIFNGMLTTTHPGSGKTVRPCLVTLRTTRDTFEELDLSRVDPIACLKHLSASVSKSPAELLPVRPILEFDMVDPRFIAESDALSLLDQRPNLMDLNPWEFESLIQNLFAKMGLDTKMTRASRDGGVDCVAYDPRPIFGGKVVIQAKRYKNTVGVSAVRDLFGTLQNEGASKGILVCTSGYGQASFDFAANKPIELIDGANLLYLLTEHAGIEAKIEIPDDWVDPPADS